tara:strand:+ start:537 stop:818 length:282 start_codon:yes stop_codon:yes gene_type:complete
MENNHKVKKPVLKIGDLVFYQPSEMNKYANGERQMGIVLTIIPEAAPLFEALPDAELWMYEYKIKWIETGYTSTLHAFNLKKVEIPLDKEEEI